MVLSLLTSISGHGQGTQCVGLNTAGTAVCTDILGITGYTSIGVPIFTIDGFTQNAGVIGQHIFAPGNAVLPSAIKDQGEVAGTYVNFAGVSQGFLLTSAGVFTSFNLPGTSLNTVVGLTAVDQIIGNFADANSATGGFILSANGTFTQVDAPGTANQATHGTSLSSINAGGTIVGTVTTSPGPQALSRTPDGSFTLFNPPGTGPLGSTANGINPSGVIVGTFTDTASLVHGYIRNLDGSFTTIDEPNASQAPGQGTSVSGINDSG